MASVNLVISMETHFQHDLLPCSISEVTGSCSGLAFIIGPRLAGHEIASEESLNFLLSFKWFNCQALLVRIVLSAIQPNPEPVP